MGKFPICFNTSTIRPRSIFEKITVAGEAGYDAIELWNEDLTAYERVGGSLSDIRQMVEDQGLKVPNVVHLSGWMDVSNTLIEKDTLGEARRLMEQGAAVGAARIIAGPAQGEVDLKRAADRYGRLMELGKEVGCLPALEFLGFVEHVNNVDTLLEIVSMANNPDTTVVLDAFHIYRGGGKDDDILKVPGNQIAIFHIDDAPRSDLPLDMIFDGDRVYPGDGILDLKGMVDRLQRQGFTGPISLELFNAEVWQEDALKVARKGMEKIKNLLGESSG